MADRTPSRLFTLVQRELQEYKTSLVWTPVVTALLLTLLMAVSVVLANRISVMGDAILQVIMLEDSAGSMNISIQIDDDDPNGGSYSYTIETEESLREEDWNFSREWTFNPTTRAKAENELDDRVDNLNPMLSVLHNILLLVLIVVTINYLLSTLFDDRKDRSILFWRSMPVSEWEEVLAKLGVALVVAPVIYIAVSILMQLDPVRLVLGNIEFGTLLFHQLSGWVLTALLVAPLYAWLLLASAGARRSAAFLAVAPPLGLILLEEFFLGTEMVRSAIGNHIPHASDSGSIAFYMAGPDWGAVNYLSLALGLVFTAAALWVAVYLRRYRWAI